MVDDPDREIDDRRGDRPDSDLAHEAPHEPDRTEQREHETESAEAELPQPDEMNAEDALHQGVGRDGDDRDLEDRPAEALQDVEPGRQERAALPERRALQHHRRHTRLRADVRGDAEHRVADQAADERREQRLPEREAEIRGGDEDEQRDAEVRPEQQRVEHAEHPQALRDGLDPPRRRLFAQLHSLRRYEPEQVRRV